MSGERTRAAMIRVPNDVHTGTNDDFGARLFTCPNTIKRNEIPATWSKRWVIIRNVGSASAEYAFSKRSGATVAASPTATDAGESNQVGGTIAAGEVQHRQLFAWSDPAEKCYFVRISGTSTSLKLELGDGQ